VPVARGRQASLAAWQPLVEQALLVSLAVQQQLAVGLELLASRAVQQWPAVALEARRLPEARAVPVWAALQSLLPTPQAASDSDLFPVRRLPFGILSSQFGALRDSSSVWQPATDPILGSSYAFQIPEATEL
jgi:hypothetical protein